MPKKSLLVETGMAMQDTLNLLCPFMMIRLSWEVVGERTKNGKEWGRGRETWLKSFTSAPKGICNVCRDVRISMQLRMSAKEGGEVPRLLSMARCRVTILPHSPAHVKKTGHSGATLWVWPTNQSPVYMRGAERETQSD